MPTLDSLHLNSFNSLRGPGWLGALASCWTESPTGDSEVACIVSLIFLADSFCRRLGDVFSLLVLGCSERVAGALEGCLGSSDISIWFR